MNDLDYCLEFVDAHENSIDLNFKKLKEINSDYETTKKFFGYARDWEIIRNLRHIQDRLSNRYMKALEYPRINCPNTEAFLGNELADIAKAFASCSNIPHFGIGISLLSSTSSALLGKISLRCDAGWKESPSIWSLMAARSGSGKSTVVGLLRSPFEEIRANITTNDSDSFFEGNQKFIIRELEAQIRKMIRDEMKANNLKFPGALKVKIEEKMKEFNFLQKELLSSLSSQNRGIIFADNVTAQGLCNLLNSKGEVVVIMTSEGTPILRFESEKDLTTYLKGHEQEGGTYQLGRQMVTLKHPYVTQTIFTQLEPGIAFLRNEKFINSGLCARFLPVILLDCEVNNGIIGEHGNDSLLYYKERYKNKIMQLYETLSKPEISSQSIIIKLESGAYHLVKAFQQKIRDEYLQEYPEKMRPWLNKAHGHAVRISFCIHVWNNSNPLETDITEREMEQAIEVIEALKEQEVFIYGERGYTAHKNAEKIVRSLLSIDNRREILDKGIDSRTIQQRTGLKKEETDNALRLLDKYDYIRVYDGVSSNLTVILHPFFYERRDNPFLGRIL